jgi:AcrR family transcriptional regulator
VSDTRDKLIDAARRCFYRQGIAATGVEAIAAEAGVTKRTLYNHFASKEDLVVAYLRQRHDQWLPVLHAHLAHADADVESQLDALVEAYVDLPGEDSFRGCALVNAAAEVVEEDDPALAVIRAQIDLVHSIIVDILRRDPAVEDADDLATQVQMVLEGMCGLGGIRRTTGVTAPAKAAVRAVLAAAPRTAGAP